jgi:peptidoglycan/xylan/chitin deacetylase (PgdA/CDA1 family)
VPIKAGSRFTVAAHDDSLGIGRHDDESGDFSLEVSSPLVPVVAERTCYFTYKPFWSGGTDVVGATAPATDWYFAEGCTRQGFDTYLCIANPGEQNALVDVTYYRGGGQTDTKAGIAVGAHSRLTIPVHEGALGIGRRDDASGDVSMKVSSTNGVGVVAERPMYFADRWRTMDRNAIAASWNWGHLTHGNRSRPWAAITVDCENSAGNTSRILDVLEQKGAKATCFLLANVAAHPDVLVRMANDGLEMGNHGATHAQFTKISAAQVERELATTEAEVENATGLTTKPYFRFPYGETNAGLVRQVNSLGYLSMYWSVDPQEWRSTNSLAYVINNVLTTTGPGSIVLLHDDAKSIAALPSIIDGLRARGLTLVTLSDLLYPGP